MRFGLAILALLIGLILAFGKAESFFTGLSYVGVGVLVAGFFLFGMWFVESSKRAVVVSFVVVLSVIGIWTEAKENHVPMDVVRQGQALFHSMQTNFRREFSYSLRKEYVQGYWLNCNLKKQSEYLETANKIHGAIRLPSEFGILDVFSIGEEKPPHPCKELMKKVVAEAPSLVEQLYPALYNYGKGT